MKIDIEKRIEYYLGDTEYENQKPQADNKMFLCNGSNQYKYHLKMSAGYLNYLKEMNCGLSVQTLGISVQTFLSLPN